MPAFDLVLLGNRAHGRTAGPGDVPSERADVCSAEDSHGRPAAGCESSTVSAIPPRKQRCATSLRAAPGDRVHGDRRLRIGYVVGNAVRRHPPRTRYRGAGHLAGQRWLPDDHVTGIGLDGDTAWIESVRSLSHGSPTVADVAR